MTVNFALYLKYLACFETETETLCEITKLYLIKISVDLMGFFSFGSNIFLVLAASDNYCKAPRNYCLHDIKKTFTHSYCHGYFLLYYLMKVVFLDVI